MTKDESSLHREEAARLRYRIRRLGMLELEAWLARLEPALEAGDTAVIQAALQFLELGAPELVRAMHGDAPLPAALRPWLEGSA